MTHFQIWTSVYKILAACSIGDRRDPVGAVRPILEGMVAALSIAGWYDLRLEEDARWDFHGSGNGPSLVVRVKPDFSINAYVLVLPIGWLLPEMVDVVLVMES